MRARRLAGHGPQRTARLYFCGDPANLRIARTVRANLRPIGIRVVIVQSLGCLSGPDPKARTADLLLVTRATQVLDPEPFLDAAVGDTALFGALAVPATWTTAPIATASRGRAADRRTRGWPSYARIEDDMLRDGRAVRGLRLVRRAGEYCSARSSLPRRSRAPTASSTSRRSAATG